MTKLLVPGQTKYVLLNTYIPLQKKKEYVFKQLPPRSRLLHETFVIDDLYNITFLV